LFSETQQVAISQRILQEHDLMLSSFGLITESNAIPTQGRGSPQHLQTTNQKNPSRRDTKESPSEKSMRSF
jgi:hypothetical protein